MSDEEIARKINRLYELWGNEGAETLIASEAADRDLGSASEIVDAPISETSVADLRATWPQGYRYDDIGDDDDGYVEYVDPFDPNQVEMLRLELKGIEDLAELSRAFLNGCLWRVPELHDELRRAFSDWRCISDQLYRTAGYEFIAGLAKSAAFRGSGALSTPLKFTSEDPEEPTWDRRIMKISDLHRQDAIELRGCHSFMMH